VSGIGGTQAATISFITPSPITSYTLNLCAIGTNCSSSIVTSINGVENFRNLTNIPIINGLQDLQMGGMLQDFEDNTPLPDVAERDY